MKSVRLSLPASDWICRSCRSRLRLQTASTFSIIYGQTRNASTSTPIRGKLPDAPARTRFAPSPTGNLHLGSIRTALFNFLLARRTNGQFLLRLEDTDQKRTIPGAEERLYHDLQWAGLQWDEGPLINGPYGPYRQSERLSFYRNHIQALLRSGKAYRCFCSSERIDDLNRRRHEKGLNLGYDRKCAHIPSAQADDRAHRGEAHVIRFRAPEQWPRYNDLVYGKTGHGAEKTKKLLVDEPVFEDAILIKSDGFPTYHWANVCDDYEMKITHVVRGSEWMSSTPLHIALYQALDWTPPSFAHVPLLVDQNRQKLSKRNFDSDIASFRNSGIYPETLTNFAALLGWSHQLKNDVMNLNDLINAFDLKITKGNTIVSFDKLRFLQEQHAKRRIATEGPELEQMIRDLASALLDKYGAVVVTEFIGKRKLRDVVCSMLRAESLPYRSASDYAAQCAMFFDSSQKQPPLDIKDGTLLKELRIAAAALLLVPEESWTTAVHRANLQSMQLQQEEGTTDVKTGKKQLYHYLRWALLGGTQGPSIPETLEILGYKACLDRIQKAALDTKDQEIMITRPELLRTSKFDK